MWLITHFKNGSKTVITIPYSSSKLRAITISTQSDKCAMTQSNRVEFCLLHVKLTATRFTVPAD